MPDEETDNGRADLMRRFLLLESEVGDLRFSDRKAKEERGVLEDSIIVLEAQMEAEAAATSAAVGLMREVSDEESRRLEEDFGEPTIHGSSEIHRNQRGGYDFDIVPLDDVLTWQRVTTTGEVFPGGPSDDTVNGRTSGESERSVRRPGRIVGVQMMGGPDTIGNLDLDIFKHIPTKPLTTQSLDVSGTTIYPTTSRPIIGLNLFSSPSFIRFPLPDVTIFDAGDFFSVVDINGDIDAWALDMFVRYDS